MGMLEVIGIVVAVLIVCVFCLTRRLERLEEKSDGMFKIIEKELRERVSR